jgi:hypothetical protein
MGMAQGLIDGGVDPKLIKVFLFAPHQPNQIPDVHPVDIFQYSRSGDKVSSTGLLSVLFGESTLASAGLGSFNLLSDGNDDGYGNHGIQTYTIKEVKKANPNLYKWLIEQGIINEDGTLNEDQE